MRLKFPIACALAALAGQGFAHHSFAMFDMKKDATMSGVVTEFRWTNPHSWMHLDVTDQDGAKVNWALEMTSPNNLVLSGWRRSSLKPGDKVTVTYHPLLNGKSGGSLVKVVLADNRTLENK
ncbi:MAG: hypothetical protein J7485_05060 [Sphingobium sp.]|nr:hypothetical protein [Sphingobium sp.]